MNRDYRVCKPLGIERLKVLDGRAVTTLHEYAADHADLVVIGSHGRHGLELLQGSTSNSVVHGTTCDVLAVHLPGDLGTLADFPYPEVCEAWGIDDLGEEFRAPVESSIPTLFVSGDLDGRTPISNAEEVMRGFPESSHIIVEQVGHEGFIFFASPRLIPLIGEFFSGSMPAPQRLEGPPLEFSLPQAAPQTR